MRIFTASLATETNTFSPVPTDMASFKSAFYALPGEHPDTPTLCSAVIPELRKRADEQGFDLIEGTAAWAEPGGLVRSDVYETLRDEILDQLRAALPVDAVVLGLHGAMVARDYADCEGDLLSHVRNIVGTEVVVAASLDPHSHLTAKRVAATDILAAFQEFPHTDFVERAAHVVDLALDAARGKTKPKISTFDCCMIDVYPTEKEPMRGFIDRMKAMETGDILSISFIHGFMAADVPELGAQMIVVTNDKLDQGEQLAKRLGREVVGFCGTTRMSIISLEEALNHIDVTSAKPGPIVLADIWDNPGGGVAGDNTELLMAMMKRGFTNIGVATLWDPQAVSTAIAAGEGASLVLRIGGKAGPASGVPMDVEVRVLRTVEQGWQSFGSSRVPLGRVAVVRIVDTKTDIILNTNRTQTFDPDIFTGLGINPMTKDCLIVKSTNHFYSAFAAIASEILYVQIEGLYPYDPKKTPYTQLSREIWPRIAV